ncbi:MAG: hypothetical protein NC452_11710 [Eubacterium sp.]|nr:hypothetical protein [Eubacterium sp.]
MSDNIKEIVKLPVPYLNPEDKELKYNGSRLEPRIQNQSNAIEFSGTLSSIIAGHWKINAKLKTYSKTEYRWDDGTEEGSIEDIVLEWDVIPGVFDVPKLIAGADSETASDSGAEILEFDYKGSGLYSSVEVVGFNPLVMKQGIGNITSAYKAGEYVLTFSLLNNTNDTVSATWTDGTTEEKQIKWKINRIVVDIPIPQKTVHEFEPIYGKTRLQGRDINGRTIYYTKYYVDCNPISLDLGDINKDILALDGGTLYFPGKYTAVIRFIDPDSCIWADFTEGEKTVEWEITKKTERLTFSFLEPSRFVYDGNSHKPLLKNHDDDNIDNWAKTVNGYSISQIVDGDYGDGILTKTKAGEYSETIALRDYVDTSSTSSSTLNYDLIDFCWEDGSTDPIELKWTIEKAFLTPPTLSPLVFSYDGNVHSVTISSYDTSLIEVATDSVTSASEAGKYTIKFSLINKESTVWDDGSESGSTDDVVCYWEIKEYDKGIKVPSVSETFFEYDEKEHFPFVEDYDKNIITMIGEKEINAGKYKIVFHINHENSVFWEDGTVDDKEVEWEITKKTVYCKKPFLDSSTTSFQYDGREHSPTIVDFDSISMNKEGDMETKAEEYTVTISLKEDDNVNYLWSDGSKGSVFLSWEITSAVIKVPEIEPTLFYYGGYSQYSSYRTWRYPLINGYDPYTMEADGISEGYRYGTGTFRKTAGVWYGDSQWQIGKYYVEFSLADPDSSIWSDGTRGKIIREWSIAREVQLIEKPYINVENIVFLYDGTEKEPTVINGNVTGVTLSGDLTETVIGHYTIKAELPKTLNLWDAYDYRWADNTNDDVFLEWHIVGSTAKIPSVSSTVFPYDGKEHFPAIEDFDANKIEMMGKGEIAADEYEIVFTLKEPDSCTWTDGSIEPKSFKWHITKITVNKPTISPKSIMYDGTYHTVEFEENEDDHSFVVSGFISDIMSYSGSVKEMNVNEYSIAITLNDPNSCSWTEGGSGEVILYWNITPKKVLLDKPKLDEKNIFITGHLNLSR